MHVRNIVEPKGIGRPPLEHAKDRTKTTSILDQLLCCALLNDQKPPKSASIHAPQTNISRAGSDPGRRSHIGSGSLGQAVQTNVCLHVCESHLSPLLVPLCSECE